MFQKKYREMNEKILPQKVLMEGIMEKTRGKGPQRLKFAVVAAVLALVVCAMPVMAGYVPDVAVRFKPVMESCTADGIRMEVVAASVHGATAEIYISFEDLQGDRLGSDLRVDGAELLGKSVFLSGNWGSSIGQFGYDPESGRAVMVIEENYSFWSSLRGRYLTVKELFGGKITVSVDRLYRLVETEDGQRVEETIAEGPWQIKFRIDESTYVGPRDDGVPQTTSIE